MNLDSRGCKLGILEDVICYSYKEYLELAMHLAESGSITGEKSILHIEATKINAQRLKRLNKHLTLNPQLLLEIQHITRDLIWVLLTETWCGDGAQCIPVIAGIAGQSDKINLRIILRDENPVIMNRYLTNDARAIPKLIVFDAQSGIEVGLWGLRPEKISKLVRDLKGLQPEISKDKFHEILHLWYTRDKTNAIQDDFLNLLKNWN
ncbi:hypothetical protein BH11BAC2_BH11BAC2_08670 [soil metagenome]